MIDSTLEHNQAFRFQLSEHREMKQIVSHKDTMLAFADAIYHLKQIRRQKPDLTWAQVIAQDDRYAKLQGKGLSILENTYRLYQESRVASTFWSNKVVDEAGLVEMKKQLHMDSRINLNLRDITWQGDCCLVRLNNKQLNDYYRQRESEGGKTVPPNTAIGAYVSTYLFLVDNEGRKCPVVLINNQAQQSTVDHEIEHVLFFKYYWRLPYEDFIPKETDSPRQEAKKEEKERIEASSPEYILSESIKLLEAHLREKRTLFYTETLSEIAGKDAQIDVGYSPFRARDFSPEIRLGDPYSIYAAEIRDYMEGIKDALIEKNLSYEIYTKIAYELEKQAEIFASQNEVIENWIAELIKQTPDREKILAILEAIPINHIETIGYFIGRELTELTQEFKAQAQEKKVKPWELPFDYPGLDEIMKTYYEVSEDKRKIHLEEIEENALVNFAIAEKKRGKPKKNILDEVNRLLPQTTIDQSMYNSVLFPISNIP